VAVNRINIELERIGVNPTTPQASTVTRLRNAIAQLWPDESLDVVWWWTKPEREAVTALNG